MNRTDPVPVRTGASAWRASDRAWLAMALAALWLPILGLLSPSWDVDARYRHGWAVPVLCLYLAVHRMRPDPRPSRNHPTAARVQSGHPPRPLAECRRANPTRDRPATDESVVAWTRRRVRSWTGWAWVLGALLLLPLRVLQEANPLWRLASYGLVLDGVALTLLLLPGACARRRGAAGLLPPGGRFAFPVCFVLMAVPWPTQLERIVVEHLTHLNTTLVVDAAELLRIPAVTHGNVIEVVHGLVGMDEACSGIRSSQATLMMALFLGEFYRANVRRRVWLIAFGFGAAMLLNLTRALILVLVADGAGLEMMQRWHDPTGLGILIGCFVVLWVIAAHGSYWLPTGKSAAPQSWRSPKHPCRSAWRSDNARPLFAPGSFACALLISASLLSVAGSELWFRAYEPPPGSGPHWLAASPRNATLLPMADAVRAQLQFDSGCAATWQEPTGVTWQLFYFRWNAAAGLRDRVRVQLARSHRPDICVPAHGDPLRAEHDTVTIVLDGLRLPFRVYEFGAQKRRLFLFYCVCEDGNSSGTMASFRESTRARLAAAWAGNRGRGQRVLEMAVTGLDNVQAATEAFARELPKIIVSDGGL